METGSGLERQKIGLRDERPGAENTSPRPPCSSPFSPLPLSSFPLPPTHLHPRPVARDTPPLPSPPHSRPLPTATTPNSQLPTPAVHPKTRILSSTNPRPCVPFCCARRALRAAADFHTTDITVFTAARANHTEPACNPRPNTRASDHQPPVAATSPASEPEAARSACGTVGSQAPARPGSIVAAPCS